MLTKACTRPDGPPCTEHKIALPPPKSSCQSCAKPEDCFDYSRCSLVSGFPIYVYGVQQNHGLKKSARDPRDVLTDNNFIVTSNPDLACVFLVEVDNIGNLEELPHWRGDGRNHILWAKSGAVDYSGGLNMALIIQTAFTKSPFRDQLYKNMSSGKTDSQ